jgi:hypothetical protein
MSTTMKPEGRSVTAEAFPALPIREGADTPDVKKAQAVRKSAALNMVPMAAQNPILPESLMVHLLSQPFIDPVPPLTLCPGTA